MNTLRIQDFLQHCNWSHDTRDITYPPNRQFHLTHVWPDGLPETEEDVNDDKYPTGVSDLLIPESNFYPWSIITAQVCHFHLSLVLLLLLIK